MWRNTVAIHNVLKKKITQLNSQPIQYLKKLVKIILKKKIKKQKIKKKKSILGRKKNM